MGVDEDFERVRTALRTEEQALAQEFERIDAQARATVDASVEHVRAELATQADRIREAIAQQRHDVEAHSEQLRQEVEGLEPTGEDAEATGEDAEATAEGTGPTGDAVVPAVDGDPTHADQTEDTGVEHTVPAGDAPDDTIGDVERGD